MCERTCTSIFVFRYKRIAPLSNRWELFCEQALSGCKYFRPGAVQVIGVPDEERHRLFQVRVTIPCKPTGYIEASVFQQGQQLAERALKARHPHANLSPRPEWGQVSCAMLNDDAGATIRRVQAA